ncbi:MAG: hypothetical protein M5R36_19455 [Deltaproteobacteria bacterium]|nr:hypothetical protein [Deltaproteobacteria bacterium]
MRSMDGAVFVSNRVLELYREAKITPPLSEAIPNVPPRNETAEDGGHLAADLGISGRRILAYVGRYSLGRVRKY